jgi:hypothetical protein
LNGNNWLIDIKNSSVGGRVKIEVGERIKIIGDKDIDDIFTANEIRPWMGNGLKKNEIKGKIMR